MMFLGKIFPSLFSIKPKILDKFSLHNPFNNLKSLTTLFPILVLILLSVSPSLSLAANLFPVPDGDVSIKVIGAIFGGLLETSSGSNPMLAGIKMFNGGVLIIGGVLAAYTILAGTLSTAHDGEMLGKKFSSVWIPIRYAMGTALVLPVVGGGYCVMQAIVIWLVVQGIGLADTVWASYIATPTASANLTIPNNFMLSIAEEAFVDSVCYRSYAKAISDAPAILKWTKYNYTMTQTSTGYSYGDTTALVRTSGCGQINFPTTTTQDLARNNTPTTNPGYLGDIAQIFKPIDVSAIINAHRAQTTTLVNAVDMIAADAISKYDTMTPEESTATYQKIKDAAAAYGTAIKGVAQSTSSVSGYDEIQKSASDQGWILAGAWFTRIVQMNDTIHQAVAAGATSSSFLRGKGLDDQIFRDARKYREIGKNVLSNNPKLATKESESDDKKSDKNTTEADSRTSSLVADIGASIAEDITKVNLYELKNDARHPLIIANDLGNRLIDLCVELMGDFAAVALASSIISVGLVQSAITAMGWFVDLPVKALMTVALATSYILPNMPFIIWIGCITGWILLVIEAVIAAPLWAIMHLHPNGDDLTGRGGNGYSLVLSLLLRPVLMVFGMIAAIVISSVMGEFINKTFFEVFVQNVGMSSGFFGLFSLAMGTIIYFVVMFTFLKKCFGIIYQLPDQMLQWIGGGGSALGQFAGEFSSASDKGGSAAAALGGFAASSLAKGGQGITQSLSNKANNQAKANELQNQKSAASLDGKAGDGAANTRDSFSSMRGNANNKEAYEKGMSAAVASDPDSGRAQFEAAFAASDSSGHSGYGNSASMAAESIGQSIAQGNISEQAHGNYLTAMSSSGGSIDGGKLKAAQATFSKMSKNVGSEAASKILSSAAAGGGGSEAIYKRASESYKAVKASTASEPKATPSSDTNE